MDQITLFDLGIEEPKPLSPVFFKIPSAYLGFCPVCKNEVYFRPTNFKHESEYCWNPCDYENIGKKRCGVCNNEFGKDSRPLDNMECVSGVAVMEWKGAIDYGTDKPI